LNLGASVWGSTTVFGFDFFGNTNRIGHGGNNLEGGEILADDDQEKNGGG
jgi:hypothetical protein